MIISLVNQKGGVGKTTLAINLASYLASLGGGVLLIDADPQGNATSTIGIEILEDTYTLNDVLASIASGADPSATLQALQPAPAPWGIDVLPADRLLASRETDIALGRESRLRTALSVLKDRYDHIVIDCPPSLGMLTTNALVASDTAFIVTTARETATDGVAEIISTIVTVRAHYNHSLRLAGIILNSYRADRVDRRQWHDWLIHAYGDYVLEPAIPEREAIAVAGSRHLPIDLTSSELSSCFDSITLALTKEQINEVA